MKERPILFSGPMVRAILEGRKTQTRRPVKPITQKISANQIEQVKSPYGQPGDRLWVRETFSPWADEWNAIVYKADNYVRRFDIGKHLGEPAHPDYYLKYELLALSGDDKTGWRPSIHMPRWASRLLLEITSVRVERIREITIEDLAREGYDTDFRRAVADESFGGSWNRTYPGSWDRNDWVWVMEFKRVQP